MGCIFCKIANGEIPSTKVYEDDKMARIPRPRPAGAGAHSDDSKGAHRFRR